MTTLEEIEKIRSKGYELLPHAKRTLYKKEFTYHVITIELVKNKLFTYKAEFLFIDSLLTINPRGDITLDGFEKICQVYRRILL